MRKIKERIEESGYDAGLVLGFGTLIVTGTAGLIVRVVYGI